MRILVIGDLVLDRDVEGKVARIAPDAPVPVLEVGGTKERAGGAGLAATLLCRDGLNVVLATVAGDDDPGGTLAARCSGMMTWLPLGTTPRTRTITRIRSGGQSLLRVDEPGTDVDPRAGLHLGDLERAVADCDAILVADYGAGLVSHPGVRKVIGRRRPGTPVVWDPHPRGEDPVPKTTVVTPNRAEAVLMAARAARTLAPAADSPGGCPISAAHAPAQLADVLRRLWRVHAVAVTAGDHGVFTATPDAAPVFTPVPSPCQGDALGAGDRFAGSLVTALGSGATIDEAINHAVQDVASWLWSGGVGLIATGTSDQSGSGHQRGARPALPVPTLDPDGGLRSALRLATTVRKRGGAVVATGGCFDVLHAGHLQSLRAARRLGDCLVVLLNSDRSVRRLKGPQRPVNHLADRRCLLEAIDCVDAVAVFEEDTPETALRLLRPDIWAKGGDYARSDLPELRVLAEWGGRVTFLPYLAGRSTTDIVNQLKEERSNEP